MIPSNEYEVIIYFSKEASKAGIDIISGSPAFPDLVIKKDGREYRAEVEYLSSHFRLHGHSEEGCDLVICWTDNDPFLLIPVIELSNPLWINYEFELPGFDDRVVKAARYWESRAKDAERRLSKLMNGDKISSFGVDLLSGSLSDYELEVISGAAENGGRVTFSLLREFGFSRSTADKFRKKIVDLGVARKSRDDDNAIVLIQ